jgi:hypothetical protein
MSFTTVDEQDTDIIPPESSNLERAGPVTKALLSRLEEKPSEILGMICNTLYT